MIACFQINSISLYISTKPSRQLISSYYFTLTCYFHFVIIFYLFFSLSLSLCGHFLEQLFSLIMSGDKKHILFTVVREMCRLFGHLFSLFLSEPFIKCYTRLIDDIDDYFHLKSKSLHARRKWKKEETKNLLPVMLIDWWNPCSLFFCFLCRLLLLSSILLWHSMSRQHGEWQRKRTVFTRMFEGGTKILRAVCTFCLTVFLYNLISWMGLYVFVCVWGALLHIKGFRVNCESKRCTNTRDTRETMLRISVASVNWMIASGSIFHSLTVTEEEEWRRRRRNQEK